MSEPGDPSPCGAPAPPPDPAYVNRFLPVASWAMYDFANTVYSGIVVTAFLPLYLTIELGRPLSDFGIANTLSMILAALISPFLGCLPDRTGRTKRYLLWATGACILCTAALSAPGSPVVAILAVFFLSNVAYQVAMVFYNALLPTVATPERQGSVSGWGVALGYIGVIAAVLSAQFFFTTPEEGDLHGQLSGWKLDGLSDDNSERFNVWASLRKEAAPEGLVFRVELYRSPAMTEDLRVATATSRPGASLPAVLAFEPGLPNSPLRGSVTVERYVADASGIRVHLSYRLVFLSAAVLFLLATLPLVVFVRERAVAKPEPLSWKVASAGWRGVLGTLRGLPAHRDLLLFLVGYFLCCDVLNMAIAWFAVYFAKVFSFTSGQINLILAGMSAAAFLAGLVMGKLTDKIGPRRAVVTAALCLAVTLPCVSLLPEPWMAVTVILTLGAPGLAGLWVAGRKLLIELAPPDRIGEYFGLEGIAAKISVVGTLVFAVLVDHLPGEGHWNFKLAILLQVAVLIPGIVCLAMVRLPARASAAGVAPPAGD